MLSEPKTWVQVGILSLLIGAYLLYSAFSLAGEQSTAAGWPTVDGHIDDVEIIRKSDTAYYPKVSYSYGVKGRTYSSQRVWLTEPKTFATPRLATAAVNNPSNMVPVHYDPSSPDNAVMLTNGDTGLLSTSSGRWGVGLTIFALVSFGLSIYYKRAQESWHVA